MSNDLPSSSDCLLRSFGISLVGEIPWGTHLCQFYESKQDLIDILVPYFVEGLRNNEFCMWVTSPPLEVEEAKQALAQAMPNLDDYLRNGQIEIISYKDWYLQEGKFDANRVLNGWVKKEKDALKNGFEGLRLTGNTFWIERSLWQSFVDYEEAVNNVIGKHKLLALCTYCLKNCSGTDVLDVVRNHVGTLLKQTGRWYMVEDAARRKAVNGAKKLVESRYSALFENMQDAFAYHKLLVDEAGRPVDYVFLEVNPAFERMTGLKRDEIIGKRVTESLPGIEKDPADWIGVYGKVALTGEKVRFQNYAESLQRWYQVSAYSPEKGYFVATFEDSTDRKKSEDALKALNNELEDRVRQRTAQVSAERQRLYNVLEALPSYVILLDKSHHVVFANKVFRESFGEDHGKRCHEYLFNKDYECENCETYRVYKENKPQHWCWTGPNGRNYDIYDFPFKEADGSTLILEMGIDITEQKKIEKQLKDSERLATIGATAGMVGHDIRNPLQAIISDIYLAKSDLEPLSDSEGKKNLLESLDGIEKNVTYINKIVLDLQDFSRPFNPVFREVDFEGLCEEILTKNGVPENVAASCEVDEKSKRLVSDPDLLRRIMSNLVSNAIQAMPNGGRLDFRAYNDAGHTILSVKDTGIGIPEGARDKLFTPLFTTKSRGQGFGLAVVKRITEALGGTITFESTVGKGTNFIIRLPPKEVGR
jgi:PAS domain S-box-containing protein